MKSLRLRVAHLQQSTRAWVPGPSLRRRPMVKEMRQRLHELQADVVFLQEVQGQNNRFAKALRAVACRSAGPVPGAGPRVLPPFPGRLWPQCPLPARASRQRAAVAVSHPVHREPRFLRPRVRAARCPALRAADGRARGALLRHPLSGCSPVAGPVRPVRSSTGSAPRCLPVPRC